LTPHFCESIGVLTKRIEHGAAFLQELVASAIVAGDVQIAPEVNANT